MLRQMSSRSIHDHVLRMIIGLVGLLGFLESIGFVELLGFIGLLRFWVQWNDGIVEWVSKAKDYELRVTGQRKKRYGGMEEWNGGMVERWVWRALTE